MILVINYIDLLESNLKEMVVPAVQYLILLRHIKIYIQFKTSY
jgi:hypothetical protein